MIVTDDNVYDYFQAVLLDMANSDAIGWRCLACGWEHATEDLPAPHHCPSDGMMQRAFMGVGEDE